MNVALLPNKPSHHRGFTFDIVGAYRSDKEAEGDVIHAGLLAKDSDLAWGEPTDLHHMLIGGLNLPSSQKVHLVAQISLTATQRTDLEAWLSIMRPRTASCHYICRPERLIVPRGNQQLYRFSCVGLVLDAYASIDIEILDGPYPPQTLTDLGRVWPLLRRQSASARAVLGLGGVGPWDVAVPGYLFHAVRLPHRPALDELRFP